MRIKIEPTNRGFRAGVFTDLYGQACSIQESSLATEACVWLGADHETVHPTTGEKCGARMHLTQDMAEALIPLLQRFVETGHL